MLKYVGGGFIPGIPAQDLSDAELEELKERLDRKDVVDVLLQSGLYVEMKAEVTVHEDKIMRRKAENKVGG
jgi:hypothetical protein